jgi:6-pyruvoyl-tetrahydropterin synthase
MPTIYNYIDNIDLAMLHTNESNEVKLHGRSFSVSVSIMGELNGEEQVIIDFSTVKTKLRTILKSKVDHKMWVAPGHVSIDKGIAAGVVSELNIAANNAFTFMVPEDAIFIVSDASMPDLVKSTTAVENMLTELLNEELEELEESYTVNVRLNSTIPVPPILNTNPGNALICIPFNYTHGLPRSTSRGCQNPLHGHSSAVFMEWNGPTTCEFDKLREVLQDVIFINYNDFDLDSKTLQYEAPRGKFHVGYNNCQNSIMMFNRDTTVENLIFLVFTGYFTYSELIYLKQNGLNRVVFTEGLDKGSVASIDEILSFASNELAIAMTS